MTVSDSVRIKPGAGVTPEVTFTVSANGEAGITLNGVEQLIIDGSNTVGGESHDLKIVMSGSYDVSGIEIANDGSQGSSNNTIKHTEIVGVGSTGLNYGIYGYGDDLDNAMLLMTEKRC